MATDPKQRCSLTNRLFLFVLLVWPAFLGIPSRGFPAEARSVDSQEKPAAPEKTALEQKEQGQAVALPLAKGKKLVLKDGTFQIVRSYERRGERVRYYSMERSAWEEIPYDLVDWETTRKAEAEEERRNQEEIEKLRAAQAMERSAEIDVDASVEITPGVFLPSGEGLWAVEGRSLVPLNQAAADVKLDKGRLFEQVISPVPIIPSRHRVQIAGKRAEVRLTTKQPEFYMRTADAREPSLELVRADVKGDKRQVEQISTNIAGQHSSKRNSISMERWKVARGVFRFTLSQPLEPGEYVLGEILPEGMNLYVWDFGVDARGSGSSVTRTKSGSQKSTAPAKQKP